MGNLNSDTNRVYTIMHKSLKCDADEAKQWIKDRSAKLTFEAKEEKLISFEWYLNNDETEATLLESFEDSDGLKKRFENLMDGPIVPEWSERFELKYMMVFGNVKTDVIESLKPFGATFHTFSGGFNHRQIKNILKPSVQWDGWSTE